MLLDVYSLVLPVTNETLAYAMKWLLIYFAYMLVLSIFFPPFKVKGFPDPKGKVLDYRLNGLQIYIFTCLLYFANRYFMGFTLRPLITHFWSFFEAANIFAFIVSILLFITGRRSQDYNPHDQSWTPRWFNDFWFGATQNPRFLGVDLKMGFYQPSLIGLQLLFFAFAEYSYDKYGSLTTGMWLYQIFWSGYFLSHYIKEEFMLSTWDIIAENFGFMLVWGDSVYLPFLYSLSGWYIADLRSEYSTNTYIILAICHLGAHYLFRVSNWQKFYYRRLGVKTTIFGTPRTLKDKLLISGFWGIGRHLNYTGEILTYFTINANCGTYSIVPYLVPISLILLLTQRAARDDNKCRKKYGELWTEYCQIAKFKMVPYIY